FRRDFDLNAPSRRDRQLGTYLFVGAEGGCNAPRQQASDEVRCDGRAVISNRLEKRRVGKALVAVSDPYASESAPRSRHGSDPVEPSLDLRMRGVQVDIRGARTLHARDERRERSYSIARQLISRMHRVRIGGRRSSGNLTKQRENCGLAHMKS